MTLDRQQQVITSSTMLAEIARELDKEFTSAAARVGDARAAACAGGETGIKHVEFAERVCSAVIDRASRSVSGVIAGALMLRSKKVDVAESCQCPVSSSACPGRCHQSMLLLEAHLLDISEIQGNP